jgi:FixJ family two-component response regulator
MDHEALVVVVDDDERICRALERVLTGAGYRVRTFTNPRRYIAEQSWLEPDCLIIDIRLSDLDGVAIYREGRAAGIETPAIFITGSADLDAAVKAMKLGAVDLLEKPLDESVLLESVDHAIQVGNELREDRYELAALWRALSTFTPREAQVCALFSSGRLNKQIAALIGTTEKTVKVHRARAMSKLGAHSVAELVRAVDRLLESNPPTSIIAPDHTVVHAPPGVRVMHDALARVAQPGERVTGRIERIREHSSGSSDSADHPRAI